MIRIMFFIGRLSGLRIDMVWRNVGERDPAPAENSRAFSKQSAPFISGVSICNVTLGRGQNKVNNNLSHDKLGF